MLWFKCSPSSHMLRAGQSLVGPMCFGLNAQFIPHAECRTSVDRTHEPDAAERFGVDLLALLVTLTTSADEAAGSETWTAVLQAAFQV